MPTPNKADSPAPSTKTALQLAHEVATRTNVVRPFVIVPRTVPEDADRDRLAVASEQLHNKLADVATLLVLLREQLDTVSLPAETYRTFSAALALLGERQGA